METSVIQRPLILGQGNEVTVTLSLADLRALDAALALVRPFVSTLPGEAVIVMASLDNALRMAQSKE